MDHPGKAANLARGQMNREDEHYPVPVRAYEFGLTRLIRPSRRNSTGIYICICVVRGHSSICTEHHQYVSMNITYNIVWITQVRLPILLVVR